MMLGVLQSTVSDFSVFSYPRSLLSSTICQEKHETDIEERYCLKQHLQDYDDDEWEELLAREVMLFWESDENEHDFLEPDDYENVSIDSEERKIDPEEEDSKIILQNDCPSNVEKDVLPVPPPTPESLSSTPSLIGGQGESEGPSSPERSVVTDSDYEDDKNTDKGVSGDTIRPSSLGKRKRKRGRISKAYYPRKQFYRAESTTSISTLSSITSTGSTVTNSTAAFLRSMAGSENPWKCPHCPWIQHTQRLPDFLRHQRSHFVSQSDWPCPNPKCGKGFARKDSLKRHLDNKATGCKRPPGYTVC